MVNFSLYFQPNQWVSDNFEPVNLSWLRCNTNPDIVQGHGLAFLEDPSKISDDNRSMWCNLHITPALSSVVVEVHSLEEVTYWVKKKCLGSDTDPMESGMANMVMALGTDPWPSTLRLARVVVAPDQKLCSLKEAVDSAKEHFERPKVLEASHYFLTPVYMEAPFLLSDAGLHTEDGSAIPIGVAAFAVSPGDNAVNLSASEGATSNLMLWHLLHLSADLVMIPLQLSLPGWTGMRRMKVGYESFIHFSATYLPPNTPESQCLLQQLMILKDLRVPDPQVLLDMTDQLDSLRTASP